MDLPAIMTKFTEEERDAFVRRCRTKIINGRWTGMYAGKRPNALGFTGRPSDRMVTIRSTEEQQLGLRKGGLLQRTEPRHKGTRPRKPFVNVMVTHAVLIEAGRYPTEECNVASHICHHNICVDANHLTWESATHNWRRERLCRINSVCVCNLSPPCRFDLH